MGESCTASIVPSAEIDGSLQQRRKISSGCLFGDVAKLVWTKPDAAIADIAGVSDRAARDYLNGKVAPPAVVMAEMQREILARK